MNLDGFHYEKSPNSPGYKVPAYKLEQAQKIIPGRDYDSWEYFTEVPVRGTQFDFYWYSYPDLMYLMDRSLEQVQTSAKLYKWRIRRNNTTHLTQIYLYDILVTSWQYMLKYYGNKIDMELYNEAVERRENQMLSVQHP